MIIKEVLGNLQNANISGKVIERVSLEWFELDKRRLRKVTDGGTEVGIAAEGFLRLQDGDILYDEGGTLIVVELLAAEAIVLVPKTMTEMAQVCYQLGNRHAPVFLDQGQVLIPWDPTIAEWLTKSGISMQIEKRRLKHALHAAVNHQH